MKLGVLVAVLLGLPFSSWAASQSLKCKSATEDTFRAEIRFDEWVLGKPCQFDLTGVREPVFGASGIWMTTTHRVDLEQLFALGQMDQVPVDIVYIRRDAGSAFVIKIDPIRYFQNDLSKVKVFIELYSPAGESMEIELGDFKCERS